MSEVARTLARFRDQMLDEGACRGEELGHVDGQRAVVHAALERRFGPLPAWARRDIAESSAERIARIAKRLFAGEKKLAYVLEPDRVPGRHRYVSPSARRWIEEGFELGRAHGEELGARELVTALLISRFGELTASARREIEGAGLARIAAIGARLVDAQTLAEAMYGSD